MRRDQRAARPFMRSYLLALTLTAPACALGLPPEQGYQLQYHPDRRGAALAATVSGVLSPEQCQPALERSARRAAAALCGAASGGYSITVTGVLSAVSRAEGAEPQGRSTVYGTLLCAR